MINYSCFSKKELVEAILNCENTYNLDKYLAQIFEKKSIFYIDESQRTFTEFLDAYKNGDYEKALELKNKHEKIERQIERLNKAID